ncbi:glycosyltransferase [Paenibacillus sp. sgz5001063]|uniref:glycosyltransferase n=1 Tax=Paenibacillus sp. sgz5001063 TaxID=3242474 RepID=UPI0036D27DE9
MIPVSVCLIVKNEEKNIEQCLRSVFAFTRDIIVVDTGSGDATIEIAKRFTNKVFNFCWNDSFSEARNFALSKASQPYILIMDADEIFDQNTVNNLEVFCQRNDNVAGRVIIRNLTSHNEVTSTEIVRVFRNDGDFMYKGRIHEQVIMKNGNIPVTCSTGIILLHSGYLHEAIVLQNKIKRNVDLLEIELNEDPTNPYTWYQLGKTHYVNKNYLEAASTFQSSIDLLAIQGVIPQYVSSLLVNYAYTLLNLKDFTHLFAIIDTGIDLYPDFTDIYFIYGAALLELKDIQYIDKIQEVFKYCIQLGEPDPSQYETVVGVGSFRSYYNLGVFHEARGDKAEAISYYKIAEEWNYTPAIERLKLLKTE